MNLPRILRKLAAIALLGGGLAGCVSPPPPPDAHLTYGTVAAPTMQLGIDIDFYTYPGQDIATAASQDVAYVKSLHANAISVSFPYFTPGKNSSTVTGNNETPTPADLAVLISAAERAGLYVSLRPLLDEGRQSIDTSRTAWQPADQRGWFSSYEKFLIPYARMAQKTHVPEFIDGTEFTVFGGSPDWNGVVAALRGVYTGTIVYANNWGIPLAGNGGSGVGEAVDAYQPLRVPEHAEVARLTAAWHAYDRTLPPGTVITEIDIAAVPGAYAQPYQTQWKVSGLVPDIQSRYFTAACNAMASEHLGGIYFWAVGFGQTLDNPPTTADPTAWVAGPGAAAISSCFQQLAG